MNNADEDEEEEDDMVAELKQEDFVGETIAYIWPID